MDDHRHMRERANALSPQLFVYSRQYSMEWGEHPFPVAKFRLLYERLLADGTATPANMCEPAVANIEDLLLAHTREYIEHLEALAADGLAAESVFEAPLDTRVWQALLAAVGGSIRAAELALANGAAMNLAGGFHHAGPAWGGGFCFVNDIAVAIRKAQQARPGLRAAVIDCDLHQGDGTAVIFSGDASVFTFSMHQQNLFPPKQRSDLDIGLPDYAGDTVYLANLERGLEAMLAHRPALAFGTDAPVVPADPRDTLYAAVLRRRRTGQPAAVLLWRGWPARGIIPGWWRRCRRAAG